MKKNGNNDLDSIGGMNLGYTSGLHIDNDHVWLSTGGVEWIDISNTPNLNALDDYSPAHDSPRDIFVSNGYVYVSVDGFGLYILKTHPVGVAPSPSETKFVVYPNPFQASLSLELGSSTQTTITIMDALGRSLYQKTMDTTKQGQKENLNLANFNSGIYYLQIQTNDNMLVEKIIKL